MEAENVIMLKKKATTSQNHRRNVSEMHSLTQHVITSYSKTKACGYRNTHGKNV